MFLYTPIMFVKKGYKLVFNVNWTKNSKTKYEEQYYVEEY